MELLEKMPSDHYKATTKPEVDVPLGLVPIVVGITGHGDIAEVDLPRLETMVKRELKVFQMRCPNSPHVLLSGLSEVTDRLVARWALESNWTLGAVLALPQEEFEDVYLSSDESITEFRALLQDCTFVHTVASPGTPRPNCDKRVGDWIARHAIWLIALCPDRHLEGSKCNSYVVNAFLNGIPDPASVGLSWATPVLPDTGPVVQILMQQRLNDDKTADVRSSTDAPMDHWPVPTGTHSKEEEKRRWQRILYHIDEFNKRAHVALDVSRTKVTEKRNYLDKNGDLGSDLTEGANRASWLFSVADLIAEKAQKSRDRQFIFMICCALIAVVMEQLYSGPCEHPAWLAAALVCVLLAALPAVLRATSAKTVDRCIHKRYPVKPSAAQRFAAAMRGYVDFESRYLDYRALAEACRVQYFWKRIGSKDSAADYHLADQRDELEWIRQAVRSTEVGIELASRPVRSQDLEDLLGSWIKDQEGFFLGNEETRKKGKIGKEQVHRERNELSILGAWLFLLLTGMVMLLALYFESRGYKAVCQWLQVVYGVCLASAAAIKVYQRTQGYAEHARSYRRMGFQMRIAADKIRNCIDNNESDVQKGSEVIREIGIAALDENSDWLLLHRDRPVGPPIG